MAEVIQCPQCDKKFRLPENPPATFTCNACQTLMDLSDFGGRDEPAKPARHAAGGLPRTRKQRAGGGGGRSRARGGGAPARSSGRRSRRGANEPDVYEDNPRGRRAAAKGRQGENNAIMIGAIVALVVVVALVVIILGSQSDDDVGGTEATKTADTKKTTAPTALTSDPATVPAAGTDPVAGGTPPAAGTTPPTKGAPKGTTPAGTTPASKGADEPKSSKPKPVRNQNIGKMKLQKFDFPEEVSDEVKEQVKEAIVHIYNGGRDGVEARDWLQSQGRVIASALVSEFAVLEQSPGFHTRNGASMAGAIDSVLRSLDGWMERRWREERQIRATSQPRFIDNVAKKWTAWWASGEWKTNPREPWDPRVDSFEEESTKKKPKKKGTGYTRRAGG